jgi:N-acetylneuraminic acid mutarotase
MNTGLCNNLFFRIFLMIPFLSVFIQSELNAQGSWSSQTNFGGNPRTDAIGFAIGNTGYIGTGYDGIQMIQRNDFWAFNATTNSWTQVASFPGTGRSGATAFAIGNKGYFGTGRDSQGLNNDFWSYDPVTNTWSQKAPFPGTAREFACGFAIYGKGYLGTGQSSIPEWDFYEYDTTANTWTQKANFSGSYPVNAATAFAVGDYGYVGLGWDGSGYKNQFWKFDPSNNSWTQTANFPGTPRAGAYGYSFCNKGIVGLGYDGLLPQDSYTYNTDNNTWSPIASLPASGRSRAVAFNIGNKGYIGTGSNINPPYMNDFWQYTFQGPFVVLGPNASICAGDCVMLDAGGGGMMYMWSNGAATQSILACIAGVYTVTVSDICGVTSTATTVITVNPVPVASITCPYPFLPSASDSVLLSATPGYVGYNWKRNGQFLPWITPNVYVKQPGSYTCVVTNVNGCTGESPAKSVRNLYFPNPPIGPTIVNQRLTADNGIAPEFQLAPNPATDDTKVLLNKLYESPITISVFTTSGKRIMTRMLEPGHSEITLDELSSGIYLVEVRSEAGVSIKKLIVL